MNMAKTKQQIRVLLADDHAIFRDGLRKLLDSDEDITIVGEAQNGAEVMKAFSKSSEAGPRREKPLLSDREKEIVQLVAQGFRNKEIGEKLFISEQTVKNHLHNIFDKLGVSDRLELALYAIHHRLIDHT